MSPTRRIFLHSSSLCMLGALAGCPADPEGPKPTTNRTENATETTDQIARTTSSTTTSTSVTTTDRRAVEFAHSSPIFDSGVADADSWYYARVFDGERSVRTFDVSKVRAEMTERQFEMLRQFVGDTDFADHSLYVVQAELPSQEYELRFEFVDRTASPPQVVVSVGHRDGEAESQSSEVTSTLLARVPDSVAPDPAVTLVDDAGARLSDSLHAVETFRPPNQSLLQSVNVHPQSYEQITERMPVPGGALVTSSETATKFVSEDASFASFVRETEFDSSYVLAVQATMPNNNYHAWPQSVEHGPSGVSVHVRQQNFTGGLNVEYTYLVLSRVPDQSTPESGTAKVQTQESDEGALFEKKIPLSASPEKWPNSKPTTTR
ncbi:hypothetical protein [Halorussus halophilus]|uniref:hypothetical protein n=1 Tax=Halorussus halophilus TaxID=2650975 RepID=UPI001300D25E|nr:hypothetical protein [Halorussus halophilus]